MKIALPVNNAMTLYRDNPHTAPKFAIYEIKNSQDCVIFTLASIVQNPWNIMREKNFDNNQVQCKCDFIKENTISHKCEHYALLDAINGCKYLLANQYCKNTKNTMRNGGIIISKIPPIINQIDMAIKNFLIGASLADTIKHIHHGS